MLIRQKKMLIGLAALVIMVVAIAGCGSEPTAQTKMTPEEIKLIERISEFSSKVEPIYQEGENSYNKLIKAITDFGYGNITKDKLVAVIEDTLKATKETKDKIDQIEVPEDLVADLDEVKGGLATAVWLREQKYPNLITVVQKPNPKSSELNAILAELKATEAFLESGRDKLNEVKQRYGIK